MNDSNPRCPACGATIPAAAPGGLCPACLLAGVANATETPAADAAPHRIPPPAPADVAAAFPQLEILELIGQGGMGVVYKARQKSLNRFVALKLLAPQRVTDPQFAERFAREARALAALSHPHIVTIHDFGTSAPPQPPDARSETPDPIPHPPFFFLLLEFVDGVNLRQAMKAGRFTPEQALAIVPPVCEALQYAHDHGIVHRDIKPENLLLDKSGRIKIADFGIAKMLESGRAELLLGPDISAAAQHSAAGDATHASAAGTPGYMAPEQKSAPQRADSRADIYSLGVVLYELLTGELPADQLQPPSRKVQIDVRLDEIVLRALEKTPELRFATATEFRERIETLSGQPAPAASKFSGGAVPARLASAARMALVVLGAGLPLGIGWLAFRVGIFFNAVCVFTLGVVVVRVFRVLWQLATGRLAAGFPRRPFGTEFRWHRWQWLIGVAFWAACVAVLELCIVPAQFAPHEYAVIRALVWAAGVILILLECLPGKSINLAFGIVRAVGVAFMVTHIGFILWPRSPSAIALAPPFAGSWVVVQGGRSSLVNHHLPVQSQSHALDLGRVVNGQMRQGDRGVRANYVSWEAPLLAPADGRVVTAVDGLEDNEIGRTDREHPAGNHLIVEIAPDRFVLLAHLRKGSLLVKAGQQVKAGQPVARCGNSGNTTEPHLHLQIQDKPSFGYSGVTFPIVLRRSGVARELRRNDAIHGGKALARPLASASSKVPEQIEFKVLRVENPPGTRDILLHFERDKNPGLGLEVWQDVTPSDGLRKQPEPGTYRDWQVKAWAGVNDRVLGWTLPPDFTEAEARAVAKDIEKRAKDWRHLEDGRLWEFATVTHRDGWKYHLLATVKRASGAVSPGPPDSESHRREPLPLAAPKASR